MEITVHILYTGKKSSVKAFVTEMVTSGLVEKIRAQEGNLQYAYFFPLEEPESVLLIDRWVNQAAIDAHHKSAMMTEIAQLRKKHHLKMTVRRFIDYLD